MTQTTDPMVTAMYGAFMMEGVRDRCQTLNGVRGYTDLLERWGNGCYEMVSAMVAYVNFIEAELAKWQEADPDLCWPGVFEYEVCSVFGIWFADYIMEHGYEPPVREAQGKLDDLIHEYFKQ